MKTKNLLLATLDEALTKAAKNMIPICRYSKYNIIDVKYTSYVNGLRIPFSRCTQSIAIIKIAYNFVNDETNPAEVL